MKRITTLFLILVFGISQIPALTNWSQLSFNYFTTDAKNSIDIVTGASADADHINTKGKFGGTLRYEVSGNINTNLYYDVSGNSFFSEKSHEQRNSFLYNEIKSKLIYQKNDTYIKFQLNNRYYEPNETNFLNLPGVEYDTQQQMVNTAIIHFKQDLGRFNLNIYNSFRDLEYKYAVPEEDDDDDKSRDDDEDEVESKSASDFDLYSLGKISYKITDELNIFTRAYLKNDFNDNDELNQTDIGGGLEYENRLDFSNSMFFRFTYYNLNSKAINDIFTHNLVTEYRYTKRFIIPLVGFLSYKNRSVYDEDHSKLLRVSNLVRFHLKHSYLTTKMKDSYVLAGLRYNPENDGTMFLGEFNQYLAEGLYITAGGKISPELFSKYTGKLEYFFSPLKSIWLKTDYTDFEARFGQNIISFGTTLIF
ncbi:MAG: hypothetical protein K9N09_06705 [Candidatus Cloacimonetes bacterium]|nr:hypothetical protein [Candidatus Cloacimonadota bacterium]MCF7815047.1 hypothetical protein [Candidatus Cloacimonadota bacterium]MCF7868373.1 hypothetical protein [Candidatus Cloacimonadota bacterium]MCF7883861.1 hypothetical protein [Candidatus Cloacimonadota bacterium]